MCVCVWLLHENGVNILLKNIIVKFNWKIDVIMKLQKAYA